MKTMKTKITLFLTAIVLSVVTLASCQLSDILGGLGTGGGTGKVTYTRLVYDEETMSVTDLTDVRSAIFNLLYDVTIVAESEAATDGEIVFGDTEREITTAAKKALDNALKKAGGDCGYIIYSEGKCVAVYWSDEDLRDTAISKFLSQCVTVQKLELDEGDVAKQCYTMADYEREKHWIALESAGADPQLVSALRSLNELFDGSYMMGWFANLWDGEIGGFYFSNSARDNEPFRPDLESTYQISIMVASNGASESTNKNDFFTNEMKIKMLEFAKRIQSPDNGYFLHPQWPQSLSVLKIDRVGRDLQWAVDLFNSFTVDTDGDGTYEKMYPNYCTPGSLKCEEHTKNGGRCDFSTASVRMSKSSGETVTFREGIVSAVSRVAYSSDSVAKATVSKTPDYSSSAAFKQWVIDYSGGIEGFMKNSGKKHELNAIQTEIFAKGFADEMAEVLIEVQQQIWDYQNANNETASGVWQTNADLAAVAGIHKYMPFLNRKDTGAAIEMDKLKAMIRTCLAVINTPIDKLEGDNGKCALNDVMNMWTGIGHVITNAKYFHTEQDVAELYELVRSEALPSIENSIATLNHYKLDEGMFVFTYGRRCLTSMYGCSASLGLEEADVNGTLMVTQMYKGVFSAMNYTPVPLCTLADGENFHRIVEGLEPIDKIPLPETKTLDFEDGDTSLISVYRQTSTGIAEIVTDPLDRGNSALMFESDQDGGSGGDTLHITAGSGGGNCYIFETKVLFTDTKDEYEAAIFQITIGGVYMLTMGNTSDGKLCFGYRSTSANPTGVVVKNNYVNTANAYEWHTIRLEIYSPESTDDGEVKVKYFIDGEYVATDNHYLNCHDSDFAGTFTKVSFYSRTNFITKIYLDDCYFSNENKMYDAEYHDISDNRN